MADRLNTAHSSPLLYRPLYCVAVFLIVCAVCAWIALPVSAADSDTVAGNVIGNSSGTVSENVDGHFELYFGNADAGDSVHCTDMMPGDTVTRIYSVKAHHNQAIDVVFSAQVKTQTLNAADVMKLRVSCPADGTVLCDAPLSEIQGKSFTYTCAEDESGVSETVYRVDLYLDTSVPDTFQGAELTVQYRWDADGSGVLARHVTEHIPLAAAAVVSGVISIGGLVLYVLMLVRRR